MYLWTSLRQQYCYSVAKRSHNTNKTQNKISNCINKHLHCMRGSRCAIVTFIVLLSRHTCEKADSKAEDKLKMWELIAFFLTSTTKSSFCNRWSKYYLLSGNIRRPSALRALTFRTQRAPNMCASPSRALLYGGAFTDLILPSPETTICCAVCKQDGDQDQCKSNKRISSLSPYFKL